MKKPADEAGFLVVDGGGIEPQKHRLTILAAEPSALRPLATEKSVS